MQPNFKPQKNKLTDYLEQIINAKEKSLENASKHKEKKSASIIRVPVNFHQAMQNSQVEIKEIEDYSVRLCELANYDEKKLEIAENYYQFKLNIYQHRNPFLNSSLSLFVFLGGIVISMFFIGDFSKLLTLSSVGIIVIKVLNDDQVFKSIVKYEYALLIIKIAIRIVKTEL